MKIKINSLAALGLAGFVLAACQSDPATPPPPPAPAPATPAALRNAPPADEETCLTAVANETGNTVEVLSSITAPANNTIIICVGPQKARWQCFTVRGKVTQVMSLTDEGAA